MPNPRSIPHLISRALGRFCGRLIGVVCVITLSSASADLVIDIDVDTLTPGIQSNRVITSGTNFSVDIIGSLVAGDSLAVYSFALGFDGSELAVVNISQPSPPLGFDGILATPMVNGNMIESFGAFTNPTTPDVTGSFLMGTIELEPLAVTGAIGDVDLELIIRPIIDGAFDGSNDLVAVPLTNASISAVPEPSPILFGMIAITFVGFRRWRARVIC